MRSFHNKTKIARLSVLKTYLDWPSLSTDMESEGRTNARVAGIVVGGFAVVVDVAEVRGIRPVSRRLPPVAAGTKPAKIQRITDKNLFLILSDKFVICFSPAA